MTPEFLPRLSRVAVCAGVVLFSSALTAWAQADFAAPTMSAAQAAAVKASPELVKGLAKELSSTPEQAAGAAGVIFGFAKSLLNPDDFAAVSKAVPGMDALLAAAPPASTSVAPATLTPGFAGASSPAMTVAPTGQMAAAFPDLSKVGIRPEMIAKAVPFLSGYLKKHGSAALSSLLGGLFKGK